MFVSNCRFDTCLLVSICRSVGDQGEDHAAVGPDGQDRAEAPPAGSREHRGAQGRGHPADAHQRAEGRQAD